MVGAHLPLYHTDTYRGTLFHHIVGWLIVDIVPLQQCGTMFRLLVVGQIVADDTTHVEVVGQLESKYRVVYLSRAYLFYIFLRTHGVGIEVVVGYSTAKHDGLEVEFLTEFLAIFVHAASQSHATVVGMDKHLDAIKDIAVGVVSVERFVASDLCIGVVAFHLVVVNNDG